MKFRLAAAALGGAGVSFLGWNYLAPSSSSSDRGFSTIQQSQLHSRHAKGMDEALKNLPIYKRFRHFASTESEQEGPCMTMFDFIDSLTTSSSSASRTESKTPSKRGNGQSEEAPGVSSTAAASASASTGSDDSKHHKLEVLFSKNPQLKKDFEQLISLVDMDKSGTIDFHEYATLQTLLAAPIDQLKGALELFDRSNSKRVNVRQFNALLRAMSAGHVGDRGGGGGGAAAGGVDGGGSVESSTDAAETAAGARVGIDASRSASGSMFGDGSSSSSTSLATFFFGETGQQTVSFQDFLGRLSEIRRLVRTIEFYLALDRSATPKATLSSVRSRMLGGEIPRGSSGFSAPSATSASLLTLQFDESAPLVELNDYMVFMALLAVSREWTPALKLYLENNNSNSNNNNNNNDNSNITNNSSCKNQITYSMLSRVLSDVDISSLIPYQSPMAKGLKIDASRGKEHHVRVFASKRQADVFSQLMDQNHDGTIDIEEVEKIAKAHSSFFAAFVPRFKETPRNVVQQWFYCMQQKS